jgi:hypothetical protein
MKHTLTLLAVLLLASPFAVAADLAFEKPAVIAAPGTEFQDKARPGVMIIGMDRTPQGRIWGCWTGTEQSPQPVVMAQIESVEGVNQAAAIARVPGVDVLFVGPADLQHDLRHHSAVPPVGYEECLALVVAAAGSAGKEAGILVRDVEDVPIYLGLGFTRIAIDSDLSILRKSWQQTLSRFRVHP